MKPFGMLPMPRPAERRLSALRLIAFATLVVAGPVAFGDVVAHGDNGFRLRTVVPVAAPATDVFDALTNHVGAWWDSSHTYGGEAAQLSIDARPGGCFCEALPGGAVQHLTVSYVDRDRELRLLGGLGPLQALGVTGAMQFVLTPVDAVTRVELTYNVSGFFPEGTAEWSGVVDRVVSEQVQRLKAYVENNGS